MDRASVGRTLLKSHTAVTVLFILNFGVFQCAVSASLPSPTSVFIASVNLRNVLKWTPGNDTPGNATFTVQYAIYGNRANGTDCWMAVRSCTEIAQNWCDLSSKTRDLKEGYFARVRAVSRNACSGWVSTLRFDPKSDTSFGPPLVTIEVQNNNAFVTIEGPMRYQPDNQMPLVSMATIYPQMMYSLSISNTYHKKTSHFTVLSGLYKHHLTGYNTEYCFSAKVKFLAMPVWCQSTEWQCVTTPPDPVLSQLPWVIVGIVVPLLSLCIMVTIGYILYQHLMGIGQKTPYILDRVFLNQPSLTFPPENISLNAITAIRPAGMMLDQRSQDTPRQYAVFMPQEPVYNCDDRSSYGLVSATSNDCGVNRKSENNLKHQKTHFSGVYAPQVATSYLQGSFHMQRQKHTAAAESSAPEQTELLHSFLNVKERMVKEDGVTAPGMEGTSQNVLEPLLSVYAAQNTKYASATHSEQSDFRLADNSGTMDLEEAEKDGMGHEEEEEEEQAKGAIFIDWDPKLGKLVLPELAKWIHGGNEPKNGGEATKDGEENENVLGGELFGGACL